MKDPPIFLYDEATSSLDTITEQVRTESKIAAQVNQRLSLNVTIIILSLRTNMLEQTVQTVKISVFTVCNVTCIFSFLW